MMQRLPPESNAIRALLRKEKEVTAPGIAKRLELAQSTVLRVLALLEAEGLVVKHAPDGRAARYSLAV